MPTPAEQCWRSHLELHSARLRLFVQWSKLEVTAVCMKIEPWHSVGALHRVT